MLGTFTSQQKRSIASLCALRKARYKGPLKESLIEQLTAVGATSLVFCYDLSLRVVATTCHYNHPVVMVTLTTAQYQVQNQLPSLMAALSVHCSIAALFTRWTLMFKNAFECRLTWSCMLRHLCVHIYYGDIAHNNKHSIQL